MYGLQHGALAHTEQQAIKGPKITSVKPFKRDSIKKRTLVHYTRINLICDICFLL